MRRNWWFRWAVTPIVLFALIFPAVLPAHAADLNCLKPDAPGCMYGLPTFQYQTLLGQMLANPTPNVRQIEVDETELGRTPNLRVVGGIAPLYDGPNGSQTGDVISPDFSTINYVRKQDSWVEVYPKRWLPPSSVTGAASSTNSGVVFDQPLAYPMAWVLIPTRPSPVPGLKPDLSVPMLERYKRVNIFATITLDEWDWYLVGPGQWIEQRRVARVLPTKKPDGVKGRWIAVDLYEQVLEVYEEDRLVYATLVSTGLPKPGFGTNRGLFRIWARLRSDDMRGGMGGPDAYYLPQVPYVMYYDGAISLHGTYWHDSFGYRRSHGCVNLSVTDARWLYEWTAGFYSDTWVYVYSSRDYIKYMPSAG